MYIYIVHLCIDLVLVVFLVLLFDPFLPLNTWLAGSLGGSRPKLLFFARGRGQLGRKASSLNLIKMLEIFLSCQYGFANREPCLFPWLFPKFV